MHLQLVDDPGRGIQLVVKQLVPDETVLATRQVVRKRILIDLFKKILEEVVEDVEVNPLRRVLLVYAFDVVANGSGPIANLVLVVHHGYDPCRERFLDVTLRRIYAPWRMRLADFW